MQKGWIYRLLFRNGKSYVGQTKRFKKRMREHALGKGTADGHVIKRAIAKYGWKSVTVIVLEEIEADNIKNPLNVAEVKWIEAVGSQKPGGYNLTAGGDAQPMDNPIVRAWQRERIGEAMRSEGVRKKKRDLWKDPVYREMQRIQRKSSSAWTLARKTCQNTQQTLEHRRETWAAKRRKELMSVDYESGLKILKTRRLKAIGNARRMKKVDPGGTGRDRVAETTAYWDKEIEEFVGSSAARTLAS